jgi:flagellar protein FlbD
MLKLTRLDHRTVAINPDHIAWVESTPDTTICLLGDRKVIVLESLEEVVQRFVTARARLGLAPSGLEEAARAALHRHSADEGGV